MFLGMSYVIKIWDTYKLNDIFKSVGKIASERTKISYMKVISLWLESGSHKKTHWHKCVSFVNKESCKIYIFHQLGVEVLFYLELVQVLA